MALIDDQPASFPPAGLSSWSWAEALGQQGVSTWLAQVSLLLAVRALVPPPLLAVGSSGDDHNGFSARYERETTTGDGQAAAIAVANGDGESTLNQTVSSANKGHHSVAGLHDGRVMSRYDRASMTMMKAARVGIADEGSRAGRRGGPLDKARSEGRQARLQV